MAKVNEKKIYTIIIIVLIILVGFFAFRSCVPSNRNGIDTIRKHMHSVENRARYIARLNSEAISQLRELEAYNNQLRNEIEYLKTTIDGLTTELRRVYEQLDTEIERSTKAVNNIGNGINEIENLISRIRKTGQTQDD